LMETITSALYDGRRKTAGLSKSLKDTAEVHREIYRAIRQRNPAEAHRLMERHIEWARDAQEQEDQERVASRKRKQKQKPANGKISGLTSRSNESSIHPRL
jgi:GntR family transcriptional regulator, transcriptional repressor for pyruvate dehydrogenase complex